TGAISISPAYIDAIDGRDGKPKRFLSNSLRLNVVGGALEDPFAGIRHLVATLIKIVLVAFAVFVVALLFIRRRAIPKPPAPIVLEPPTPVAPQRSLKDVLRNGLLHLQSTPTRAAVMQVRSVLWKIAGAPDGITLADVFTRYRPDLMRTDPQLAHVLQLTESAAFIKEQQMQTAIGELCASLEQFLSH
ncbi:MAG: hypothetical protein ABI182_04310, partial [Candidatus Baltobacteraceae bacterium]